MLDRLRTWLSFDADPDNEEDRGWGLSLWWGAVIVAAFTLAISLCHNPSDVAEEVIASPPGTVTPTTLSPVLPAGPHLVDVIGGRDDLTFFRSLIATAGIDDVLATRGPFTFFAPTDNAFAALSDEIRTALTASPELANQLLQRHAVFNTLLAADLVAAGSAETITGVVMPVSQAGGITLVEDSAIVAADLEASNGVVHAVDTVLGLADVTTPPPIDPSSVPVSQVVASRPDLTTLVTALGALETDLFEADEAGFTVFAPTDSAFDSLPAGSVDVLLATQPKLLELLGYHVVPGRLASADLTDGQVLTTASGAELVVAIADGTIRVGDATISEADIVANNGVIHIVEGVLIPPDYQLPTLNEALDLEAITFETGSSVITTEGIAVLQGAVDFLQANPEVRVAIEGHTDSQGGDASNLALSEARAESVRDYLVSQEIATDRLETSGFGESNPVADNGTAEGRAQNRRIEFRLL